jgi:cyclopropane fatty-acyl-phospholipid synthase-like methyltransferase
MANSHKEKIDSKYYDEHMFSPGAGYDFMKSLDTPFQKYRIQKVLQIYTPNRDERVLDLGCGWGTFCFYLAPLCKNITGLDFSKKSIELCQEFSKKYNYPNIDFVCMDAQNIGLKSGSYDVIISADLFEHLYPKTFEKVLDECRRLLKRGGKLVIWTPHRRHIFEILKNNNILIKKQVSHVDYKSMERILEALRRRNFLIKKSYYAESHVPLLNVLERLLLPVLPIMRRRISILAEKTD